MATSSPLRLRLARLLPAVAVAVLSTARLAAAAATCYYPNGNVADDHQACYTGGVTMCCPTGFLCLSNGLCKDPRYDDRFLRGACTDKAWADTSQCPGFCHFWPDRDEALHSCGSGRYCCENDDCCSQSTGINFLTLGEPSVVVTANSNPTKAVPGSAPAASSAPPAAGNSPSTTAAAAAPAQSSAAQNPAPANDNPSSGSSSQAQAQAPASSASSASSASHAPGTASSNHNPTTNTESSANNRASSASVSTITSLPTTIPTGNASGGGATTVFVSTTISPNSGNAGSSSGGGSNASTLGPAIGVPVGIAFVALVCGVIWLVRRGRRPRPITRADPYLINEMEGNGTSPPPVEIDAKIDPYPRQLIHEHMYELSGTSYPIELEGTKLERQIMHSP